MKVVSEQVLAAVPTYNEASVRFHVLDPILRKLGYPGSEDVYLELEEKLEYAYFHIGHRSKKDLPLGFVDYRAGLKGRRGSFVIEAKAGSVTISERDIEQAHSYAAHAQVGANYFLLSNGLEILVYETLSGPKSQPVVSLSISNLDDRFHELENVLSPENLAKNCKVSYDKRLKLCEGLGSSVRIHSGEYRLGDWEYKILVNGQDQTTHLKASVPQISRLDEELVMLQENFDLKVASGFAERDESGRIYADVSFIGATKNNNEMIKLLGFERIVFETSSEFVSMDADDPTVFESSSDFQLSKGTNVMSLFGAPMLSDADVKGNMLISTRMHKAGDCMVGIYASFSDHEFAYQPGVILKLEIKFWGDFELQLIE